MNKRLETLLDRVATWPQEAQDDAAMVLADIEDKVRVLQSLTPEQRTKLEALRETVNRSIEEGGSFTVAEVEASTAASLDAVRSRDVVGKFEWDSAYDIRRADAGLRRRPDWPTPEFADSRHWFFVTTGLDPVVHADSSKVPRSHGLADQVRQ